MSMKGCVLVTGCNGGLGSAIVSYLVNAPSIGSTHKGLYLIRKAATANNLSAVLRDAPETHRHETFDVDLGSIEAIRNATANINKRVKSGELPPLRALVLNAGYQDFDELTMTEDGFEMTWQVNFLANMLLSLFLLESFDKENGRILIVGSWSHDINGARNWTFGNAYHDLKTIFPGAEALAKGQWNRPGDDATAGFRRYGASKLCAVMLMHELAIRIGKDPNLSNISVVGLDPGAMSTDLPRRVSIAVRLGLKYLVPVFAFIMSYTTPNAFLRQTSKSAADVVRLLFDASVESPEKGEALYLNGTEEMQTGEEARNDELRKQLWDYGLGAGGIREGDTTLKHWR